MTKIWRAALVLVGFFTLIGGAGILFNDKNLSVQAQEPEFGNYTLQPLVTEGLFRPVFLIEPPDGSGRLFVLEQPGRIRIIQDGELLAAPFLDIEDITNSGPNEMGLLGLDFHPDFTENGFFFINHNTYDMNTLIVRYQVDSDNPNQTDEASREVIMAIPQPYGNHNGGMIEFGPDGYLYIGMGDGGSGGDPLGHGQDKFSLLGDMLRIDVDTPDGERLYSIPADNPYADGENGAPEVWSSGLRNPWRFSFDCVTGDLYMGDVGQNAYEEIDFQPSDSTGGENYGWNVYEGNHQYSGGSLSTEETVFPVAEYGRNDGCSVTGGYVYRGSALPELDGIYFYGDYCTGTIWWLYRNENDIWQGGDFLYTDLNISSFGQDEQGEIYVVDHSGGIYKLVARQ